MNNHKQPQWGPQSAGFGQPTAGPLPSVGKPKKKRRIFPWVFLAIQAIFIIWLITGGIGAAENYPECTGLTGRALDVCEAEQSGAAVGTTIGVGLIIGLWAAVDIILGISYAIYRLASRR